MGFVSEFCQKSLTMTKILVLLKIAQILAMTSIPNFVRGDLFVPPPFAEGVRGWVNPK